MPRAWAPATVEDDVSTVVDPASRDWRKFPRLETRYGDRLTLLMGADDDDGKATWGFTGSPGWAGLVRALFIAVRPEQDERPDDPDHVPWRLRWMKEKWGTLDVRTLGMTLYQSSVVRFFEVMSGWTCIHCGIPAEMRYGGWRRPECDACWAKADAEDHDAHRAKMAKLPPETRDAPAGYRGVFVRPSSWGGPFGLRIDRTTRC